MEINTVNFQRGRIRSSRAALVLLTLGLVCILTLISSHALAEPPQAVVYQYEVGSFKSSPAYQAVTVKRASGETVQAISAKGGEWNNFLVVHAAKLKGGHTYLAEVKYEVVTPPTFPGTFYMFARSKSLGESQDIWQRWLGDAGAKGTAKLILNLKPADDWEFTVGCKGPATEIIDSIEIREGSGLEFLPAEQSATAAPATQPLPTGFTPFTIDPPATTGPTVSAGDFGLLADKPDTVTTSEIATANMAAIKRAIDATRDQHASKLIIPKGVYRFRSDDAIPFNKLTDVEIDGQDSEIIFEKIHGNTAAVTVSDCTRTVLKNIRFDWDWTVTPLASLVRVTDVAKDGLSCDLTFPDLNEKQIALAEKAPWMQIFPMDAETFRIKSSVRIPFSVAGFTSLGTNSVRVALKKPVTLQVGDTYCVRHLYYDMSAFRIGDCQHLLFDNVIIYSMPGMGFVSRGNMSHWGFRNCKIVRREGSRNPLTASADGFHVTESLGNLFLENCEVTGLGDDCVNIHDNSAQGISKQDDHTLTLVGNPRYRMRLEAGHSIELFRSDYSPLGYTSKIDKVTFVKNDTILTLAEPLPAVLSPSTIVASEHFITSNVRVANCNFHDTSGRGVLTDAKNLTIENNVFDHVFGQAVQLAVDITPPLWSEGTPAQNVVIRGNRIDTVNAAERADNAAITTYTRWPAGSTSYPLYRDILIEKNHFTGTTGPAIALSNCQNVTVQDNVIDTPQSASSLAPFCSALLTTYTSNLTVSGNHWQAGESSLQLGVFYDPETTNDIKMTGNAVVPSTKPSAQ